MSCASSTTEETWLIRTEKNELMGPFSKAEILARMQDGRLALTDELCLGQGGYWFFLHEREECIKFLNALPPRFTPDGDEEITETGTHTDRIQVPELRERAPLDLPSAVKEAVQGAAQQTPLPDKKVVLPIVEKPTLLRWGIAVLLGLAFYLILQVFKNLRT